MMGLTWSNLKLGNGGEDDGIVNLTLRENNWQRQMIRKVRELESTKWRHKFKLRVLEL